MLPNNYQPPAGNKKPYLIRAVFIKNGGLNQFSVSYIGNDLYVENESILHEPAKKPVLSKTGLIVNLDFIPEHIFIRAEAHIVDSKLIIY